MMLKNFKIDKWCFVMPSRSAAGKFQFTLAKVNVFVLTAFEYIVAFTSCVIVVELCILLCYEVIVLKFRQRVSIFV